MLRKLRLRQKISFLIKDVYFNASLLQKEQCHVLAEEQQLFFLSM